MRLILWNWEGKDDKGEWFLVLGSWFLVLGSWWVLGIEYSVGTNWFLVSVGIECETGNRV